MRRGLFWLCGLTVLIVTVWCAGYYFVITQANQALDNLARRDAAPVRADCSDRVISGFPLQIALHCSSISVDPTDPHRPKFSVARLIGITDLTSPGSIQFTAEPPFIAKPAFGPAIHLTWDSARADGSVWLQGPERFDASLRTAQLDLVDGDNRRMAGKVENIKLQAWRVAAIPGAFEVSVDAGRLHTPALPSMIADMTGLVQVRPDPDAPTQFAGPGVAYDIARFRLAAGRFVAHLSGALQLDNNGRANGKLVLKVIALNHLPELLTPVVRADDPRLAALLAAVTALGVPAQLNGSPARKINLQVRSGRVFAGLIPLGRIPALRAQ